MSEQQRVVYEEKVTWKDRASETRVLSNRTLPVTVGSDPRFHTSMLKVNHPPISTTHTFGVEDQQHLNHSNSRFSR